MNKELMITGTHCASCKVLIEEVCQETQGIKKATVDFKTGKTIIEYGGKVDWKKLKQEIEQLGPYKVQQ